MARATNAGNLYRFRLNRQRTAFRFADPGLQDKVADNLALDDFETEGGEILFGTGFGIVTHIETGSRWRAVSGEPVRRRDHQDLEKLTTGSRGQRTGSAARLYRLSTYGSIGRVP